MQSPVLYQALVFYLFVVYLCLFGWLVLRIFYLFTHLICNLVFKLFVHKIDYFPEE